jgi:hypothetical protein
MFSGAAYSKCDLWFLMTVVRRLSLAMVVTVAGTSAALAYIGDSFIKIPGTTGHWTGADHQNWIRVEAHYWKFRPNRFYLSILEGDRLIFSGPEGPRPGVASTLVISMGKHNPDLTQLMDKCLTHTPVADLTFAESADRARTGLELGPRPARFPDFWEYRLKDVQISDCPVVADAPDQAFVLNFSDSQWLNYDAKAPETTPVVLDPKDLLKNMPAKPSTRTSTKAFVITWIAPANLVRDDQCPVMNRMPTETDYYALVPKEEADRERIKNGEKGVSYGGPSGPPEMDNRGPHRLNVGKLPGIVRDPGFAEPNTDEAIGLNLDGDDGGGAPPAGTCRHNNYRSIDGRLNGIDNQLYRVKGCVAGFQGKKGYLNQTSNTHRADGTITTLIEISGIDGKHHDQSVAVAVLYSTDKVGRDSSGKHFIPDDTFTTTRRPDLAYYATHLHGHMVDRVINIDPVKRLRMNMGLDPLLSLANARMRLELLPDGNLRGVLAGYIDWRSLAGGSSYAEQLFGFQVPGLYNALRRNADGLKDPVTGECNGISAAYEIDAIPAFIASAPPPAIPVAVAGQTADSSEISRRRRNMQITGTGTDGSGTLQ